MSEYETIERLVQTISKNLNERSKYPSSSSSYSKVNKVLKIQITRTNVSFLKKLSISCRTLIGKLTTNIITLTKSLEEAAQQGTL